MIKNQFLKNLVIYFLLAIGFIYLYIVDLDFILHPEKPQDLKSKVEFIYQQF